MSNTVKYKYPEIQEDGSRKVIDMEMIIYTPDMLDHVRDDGFLGIDVQNHLINLQNKFNAQYNLGRSQLIRETEETLGKNESEFTIDEWNIVSEQLKYGNRDRKTVDRELALTIFRYLELNIFTQVYPDINFKKLPISEQIKIADGYVAEYIKFAADFLAEDPVQEIPINSEGIKTAGKKKKTKK